MGPITIFDSTLRDGAQGTGIVFSLEDKLQAVRLLDQVGVQYVEAGNPGSNPKDEEFFHRVAELPLRHAKLVSFGSTRRKGIRPEEDSNLQAILKANTPCCSVFGKCWKFQVDTVLETTQEENLRMIEESCRFLKSHGREVIFDAEHFFDGWKDDRSYAWEALRAAVRGGADIVCLCDTNGGAFPQEVERVVKEVVGSFLSLWQCIFTRIVAWPQPIPLLQCRQGHPRFRGRCWDLASAAEMPISPRSFPVCN